MEGRPNASRLRYKKKTLLQFDWNVPSTGQSLQGEPCSPSTQEERMDWQDRRNPYPTKIMEEEKMVTLTSQMIHDASTEGHGWNRRQLKSIGVPWPPPKGWLKGMVGKQIPLSLWERFVSLRKKSSSPLTESAEGQHVQPSQQV